MAIFIAFILISLAAYFIFKSKGKPWHLPSKPIPNSWKKTLEKEVLYYSSLSTEEKKQFEYKVQEFLLNCRITGIKTSITEADKVLIAASAMIPVFGFPNWKYSNLFEVLVYPEHFNAQFETEGKDRTILGMVGTGFMNGKMILSKEALYHGFQNESDKKNTAIHEFVHLIDKADGQIDGVPEVLLEKQYTIPWIDLIGQKIDEIRSGESDINEYGATNRSEFFSVASEYFFELPKLLEKKHPKLYALMEEMFNQDMAERNLVKKKNRIGRNELCPCGSGLKFKKCCRS